MTIDYFRSAFPEFAAVSDERVVFWVTLAEKLITTDRWEGLADHAQALFTAHNLALEAAALRSGTSGVPGLTGSAASLTGKTVGPTSMSYGVPGAALAGSDGHWALTLYGLRYRQLLMMISTGVAYQVGGC